MQSDWTEEVSIYTALVALSSVSFEKFYEVFRRSNLPSELSELISNSFPTPWQAYRELAKIHHPDKVQGDEEKIKAEKAFQDIAEAYEVLSDEELRGK